ncbi:MAG: hypothetical protein WC326_15590 [Candidatus Delongbacteria bacterium]
MARTPEARIRWWLVLLYVASLAAIAWWFLQGWDFYRLDAAARPRHPDYARLTSGGALGHPLGVAGSLLIVLLLLYIPRKRWKALARWGSLRTWLDVHIWMGLSGPLLILLHSAFKVGGLVSFSFWSMTAVAVSGVLGRYLYLQIPRDESGEELDSRGIQSRQDNLLAEAGLEWERLPLAIRARLAGPAGGLASWLRDDLGWWARRSAWRRELQAAGVGDPTMALQALRRLEVLQRRRGALDAAKRLLHYWHVFHRPFAFIMVLFMLIHIVVALLFTSSHGLPT